MEDIKDVIDSKWSYMELKVCFMDEGYEIYFVHVKAYEKLQ